MSRLLRVFVVFSLRISLAAFPLHAFAEDFTVYLPDASSFEAEYVLVAPDPAYDEFGQKLQAAMHEHAQWWRAYAEQHAGEKPLPYHPKFGVPEDQYIRFQDSPMNQFLELSRQTIRIEKKISGPSIVLTLQGRQLLFDKLEIDSAKPTVTTGRDSLDFRAKLEPGPATMPPGAHQGLSFVSSTATVVKSRRSESVLVGKLVGTSTGIIRYSINTPGKVQYAYLTYALK